MTTKYQRFSPSDKAIKSIQTVLSEMLFEKYPDLDADRIYGVGKYTSDGIVSLVINYHDGNTGYNREIRICLSSLNQ